MKRSNETPMVSTPPGESDDTRKKTENGFALSELTLNKTSISNEDSQFEKSLRERFNFDIFEKCDSDNPSNWDLLTRYLQGQLGKFSEEGHNTFVSFLMQTSAYIKKEQLKNLKDLAEFTTNSKYVFPKILTEEDLLNSIDQDRSSAKQSEICQAVGYLTTIIKAFEKHINTVETFSIDNFAEVESFNSIIQARVRQLTLKKPVLIEYVTTTSSGPSGQKFKRIEKEIGEKLIDKLCEQIVLQDKDLRDEIYHQLTVSPIRDIKTGPVGIPEDDPNKKNFTFITNIGFVTKERFSLKMYVNKIITI